MRKRLFQGAFALLVAMSLAGCQQGMAPVAYHADGRPPKPIRPNRNMDDIPEVDLK